MLINQTIEKMRQLRLKAMADEFYRQMELPAMDALDFEQRLGMLIDVEWLFKENQKIKRLCREANLRFPESCFADLSYQPARKLDRSYIARLSDLAWMKEGKNIIITGCTGTGKTYLACAFGAEACRRQFRVKYYRVGRLLHEMSVAFGDGSYHQLLKKLNNVELLILDDWGLAMMNVFESGHLLEIMEERYGQKSTVISAQLPVARWHELYEDSTVADAVLDRMVHNAYRFELEGPSLRRSDALLTMNGGEPNGEGV